VIYADELRFREAFNTIEEYIERRYGVQVVIADVTDPFTGDLDGESIAVDYDQRCEDALFIIAHLLGHTVQVEYRLESPGNRHDPGHRINRRVSRSVGRV
jgi:hypothetical protein